MPCLDQSNKKEFTKMKYSLITMKHEILFLLTFIFHLSFKVRPCLDLSKKRIDEN